VILLAADEALAGAIREQFARKRIQKVYHALVFGKPPAREQVWRDHLAVQKRGGQVRTHAAGNVPAETRMRFVGQQQGAFSTSLLRLEPRTGRSHQLRVQCAKRQLPIVGDQTYGDFGLNRTFAKATGEKRLFLHSLETSFEYEWQGRKRRFRAEAPLPEAFGRKY
jgi:tRNA pseudouridine65 synthase